MDDDDEKMVVLDRDSPERRLAEHEEEADRRKYARFTLTALSVVPWVGGFMSAAAALDAEREQGRINEIQKAWLQEHERKLERLKQDLDDVIQRIERLGAAAEERLEDEGYLSVVELGFRAYDEAQTDEKREIIKAVIANAAGTDLCSDDVVRYFLEQTRLYHELHFRVVRALYREPGLTRGDIWDDLHGEDVREDSAEADLFRTIIHDLNTGRLVRQERAKTSDGRFLKNRARRPSSNVMVSSFDREKPYILTALGEQYVAYALNEIVPRLDR